MSETRRGTKSSASADPDPNSFLKSVRRSGLLTEKALDQALKSAPLAARASARALAEHFIATGDLTRYQTEKLLGSRWRGLVVGDYHILAPLGRGGMGRVYLAKSLANPAWPPYPLFPLVALKVLPPKKAEAEARTLLRFRREMELGKPLDHPNITRTLDTGEHHGVHFIAMEYVPGWTLKQVIAKDGPLPAGEAARLFVDVAAGLEHAHQKGLIHRDLKPSNIMVTSEGRAKILDLGLALLVDEALPEDPAIVGGEGYILGTMDYIAPEQTSDATNVGPRSDVYALGCSIYHAVCGMPPFPGGTSKQKMAWHRTEPAPVAQSINPAVPPAFSQIIQRCMAKNPADRPESAAALRELLLPWAAQGPAPAGAARSKKDVVAVVDKPQLDPSLWEEVPVAELDVVDGVPVSPRNRRTDDESDEESGSSSDLKKALMMVLGAVAIVAGFACLVGLLILLRMLFSN